MLCWLRYSNSVRLGRSRAEVEVNIYSSSCPINLDRALPWLRSMNSFRPFGALPRTNFAMSLQ